MALEVVAEVAGTRDLPRAGEDRGAAAAGVGMYGKGMRRSELRSHVL